MRGRVLPPSSDTNGLTVPTTLSSSHPSRPLRTRRAGAGLIIAALSVLALGAAPATAASPAAVGTASLSITAPASVDPGAGLLTVSVKAAPARKFANCTALNRVYPHGVGKVGARDKVRGKTKPVTNFTRNNAVYAANTKSDADKDGVACEKR